ncbi:MAG: carbohydrate ABC transporter permease [Chloroflexi bacterium]|nr:carbohydrate ABC transporter permease [Chloroflexota bacterium]MCL5276032.1 carbohydrate ABC transporter permease [Chloroflexota bacterium]
MDKLRSRIALGSAYIVLTLYALLSLYPFLWMISSALKSNQEVLASKSLIPSQLHFEIIVNTWDQLNFFKYFTNSVIITVFVVIGIVLVYSMAGFGFARTKFVGSNLLFISFLGLLFVPGVTVLVPLVQLLKALGLIGRDATLPQTYFGLIMPIINGAGPFSIFLFRNYFASLPSELHDAARVDGASNWGVFFRIFLPLATPIIATVGILNVIGTWNAYIWPSIVLNNPDWYTLPLKLKDLDLQIVIQWNVRMAASLIMITPVIVVFLFLQRYYIRGLTAGAIRG